MGVSQRAQDTRASETAACLRPSDGEPSGSWHYSTIGIKRVTCLIMGDAAGLRDWAAAKGSVALQDPWCCGIWFFIKEIAKEQQGIR